MKQHARAAPAKKTSFLTQFSWWLTFFTGMVLLFVFLVYQLGDLLTEKGWLVYLHSWFPEDEGRRKWVYISLSVGCALSLLFNLLAYTIPSDKRHTFQLVSLLLPSGCLVFSSYIFEWAWCIWVLLGISVFFLLRRWIRKQKKARAMKRETKKANAIQALHQRQKENIKETTKSNDDTKANKCH